MPAECAQEREDLWACCLPTKLPFQTLREVQQAAGESACSDFTWPCQPGQTHLPASRMWSLVRWQSWHRCLPYPNLSGMWPLRALI